MITSFFSSNKKTFKYLALLCSVILGFIAIFLFVYSDAFYTCCSDDVLQYFKMTEDFVLKLKTGNLSFYYYNNYLGASFFADTYYVPLDIFTFFTTILSFFMNFEIAFGFTEIVKLFLGTMMFAYFLKLRKFSNKSIFITSLIYMVCGYNCIMMAFSAFFSLVFYYPFAAVCLEKYKQGKKYLLPLCAAMLVFYNYYLGACTMLFMAVWFIFGYILDNKLVSIKEELLLNNPNLNRVNSRALLIYIGRFLKQGFICALYMALGILIACVVLLPSVSFIINDSFPRVDTLYYKWSFDSPDGFTGINAMGQYARILAEVFTPTYSTSFYAFNCSYITDHVSLYVTVTGFMIILYVFQLKDRESWIYKLYLIAEVIMLAIPIFYMIFSLNSAPYTRWMGMLNIFNLMIMAHIITKTDLKLQFKGLWAIIRSVLMIVCIFIVINYFTNKLFDMNFFSFLGNKITGKELKLVWDTDSLDEYIYDIWCLVIAVGIIIVISIFTIDKFFRKFNIIPYVLAAEIVLSLCFMFVPKFTNYNLYSLTTKKDDLNSYLSKYLENPYDGEFYRTHLNTDICNDWIYTRNYSRTNLMLSDLRIFHSFYDDETNKLVELLYDKWSASNEERNSKEILNQYSMFVHQLLGTKYVVVEADENCYLPMEYYKVVEGSNNGKYITYEYLNYQPFMIYDTMSYFNEVNGEKQVSPLYFGNNIYHLVKQQYLLSRLVYEGEEDLGLDIDFSKIINVVQKQYSQSDNSIKYDLYDPNTNMIGYYLSGEDYSKTTDIPSKGLMNFYYYLPGQGARGVEFTGAVLEYADGRREEAFNGYAFYDEIPKILWVDNNTNIINLGDGTEHDIIVEYCDYYEYEIYLNRMKDYSDLSLTMDNDKLHLTYNRENLGKNVVVIPISYNKDWKCNKDYKLVSVNGGLLGIVIPEGEASIDLTLSFTPSKLNVSALVSIGGLVIFGAYILYCGRKVFRREENIDYSSLL